MCLIIMNWNGSFDKRTIVVPKMSWIVQQFNQPKANQAWEASSIIFNFYTYWAFQMCFWSQFDIKNDEGCCWCGGGMIAYIF